VVPAARNLRDVWTIATEPFPAAHFATFPRRLVQPCIRAGTSERGVCPECGSPWVRVVESEPNAGWCAKYAEQENEWQPIKGGIRGKRVDGADHPAKRTTTGFRPTCDHDREPIPATVLDPFAGSLTTLAVAREEGCLAIGIELNADYIDIGIKHRLGQAMLPFGESK